MWHREKESELLKMSSAQWGMKHCGLKAVCLLELHNYVVRSSVSVCTLHNFNPNTYKSISFSLSLSNPPALAPHSIDFNVDLLMSASSLFTFSLS